MLSNKGMSKGEWNKFIKVLDANPKLFQKPIKGKSWKEWDNELKSQYPDKETRSKIIGSMEAKE